MKKIDIQRVLITPQMAAAWLATSKLNRKIKQNSVIEYSISMSRGEWYPDGPPITFIEDGSLSNGHHRLHAIILYGSAVEMSVQRGLSKETREVDDGNVARSLADRLTMFRPKVLNVVHRVTNLRLCVQILCPDVRVRSLSDWDHWLTVFGKGIDWVIAAQSAAPAKLKRGALSGPIAFAYKLDPQAVERFGALFFSGEGLKSGDPAWALRRYVDGGVYQKDAKSRGVVSRKVLYCVASHLQGQKITNVIDAFTTLQQFTEVYDTRAVRELLAPWQEHGSHSRTEEKKSA